MQPKLPSSLRGSFLAATLALALPSGAEAQLHLAKHGGAVNQLTTVTIDGAAGTPYLILFAFQEQTTPLTATSTLDIPITFLTLAVQVPGFFGFLPASGEVPTSFVIPSSPALLDSVLSMQALGGNSAQQVSNLIRITPALPNSFEPVLGSPPLPIVAGVVIPRDDGTLLFAGGSGPVAQSYNPDTEEFAAAGASFGVGLLSQSTPMADGRVLFTGGIDVSGQPTNAAAIFDPTNGTTTNLTMSRKRAGHGASLLANGRILVSGGMESINVTDLQSLLTGVLNSTEIFDPATGQFAPGPNMLEARAFHSSTRLANGNVLIAGGITLLPIVSIPTVSNTAYTYTASSNSFGLPQFFSGPRMLHTAVALADGRALLIGGLSLDLTAVITSGDIAQLSVSSLADLQIYSPGIFSTFQTVNGLSSARAGAGAAQLENGRILISGGFRVNLSATQFDFMALKESDLFNPAGGSLSVASPLGEARIFPLLQPLSDGTCLVAGGSTATAEVYQP